MTATRAGKLLVGVVLFPMSGLEGLFFLYLGLAGWVFQGKKPAGYELQLVLMGCVMAVQFARCLAGLAGGVLFLSSGLGPQPNRVLPRVAVALAAVAAAAFGLFLLFGYLIFVAQVL